MIENNINGAAEQDSGYGQLFANLIRRRYWILSGICSALSVAIFLTLTTKPTYESSMQLLVEPDYQAKTEPGKQQDSSNEFADPNVEVDVATQVNLMRSSALLQKAVVLLQPKYPNINVDEIKDSLVLAQVVSNDVTGKKVATKIVEISYSADDQAKTQTVLKAIQQVYQNYNLEQQKLRLAKGVFFINEQLPRVQYKVNQAAVALEQFRKRHNLIDPELQAKNLSDALNSVRQEERTNRTQIQQFQARYVALQQQLARSPKNALISSRLSQSSRYQTLLNEIQKTELAIAQQRLRFTDTSPMIQSLQEQRQNQQALLQEETQRVLGETPTQQNSGQSDILTAGQLGELDLNLAEQLVEVETNLLSLKASGQALVKTEQQLSAQLQRFPSLLAEYNRLLPEAEANRNTLQQLLAARQNLGLQLARGGFGWQVVEEAQLGEQIAPSLKMNILLGIVVGLMLGCIAAFISEAVDDAVHTSEELKKQVALPLLGIVPELPQFKASKPIIDLSLGKQQAIEPSMMQMVYWQPFRDSLDLIYKNIRLLNYAFSLKSLVITSALAGEGKTTLALGMAITAARLHQRVLLIDTDLRRPSLHKLLNLPNEQGLSTLLTSDTTLPSHSTIQLLGAHIDILTSGPTPTDPVKLLSSPQMKELMAAFEKNYDLVLLDAPPVLGMVDAIQAASLCSGVVLVGRIDRVTRTEVTQAAEMLSKSNVIGVIANGTDSPSYSNATYTEQHGSPYLPPTSNS